MIITASILCEYGEHATVLLHEIDDKGIKIKEEFYHCLTLHDAKEKLCQLLSSP